MRVTDLVGNPKSDISNRLLGGQVDIDVTASVSRTLQMTLFDPNSEVAFDSADPSDAAMYMSNMVQVLYGVKMPGWNEYMFIPVFFGPIVTLSRDDDTIEVSAYGKEHLAMGTLWHNFNAKKGANKVDVIKRLMREHAGETKFLLPDMPNARLSDDFSMVALKQTPWQGANHIAKSMNRVLYYDGAGRLRMRALGGNSNFTVEGGDGGTLVSVPSLSFSALEAKNAVVVKGKKSKDKAIVGRAVAQRNHPLSPWKLGRKVGEDIVPRYLTEVVENDKVTTNKDAERIAEDRLAHLLEQQVEVSFDITPIPYLEEYDRVNLIYSTYNTGAFTLKQFSIPLTIGDVMSVGYNKRLLTIKNRNKPKKGPKKGPKSGRKD